MITFVFFVRDADETIAWIAEKDVVLSTDDFGRDLGSVQQLQRKHDGVERDLAALEEKVKLNEKRINRASFYDGTKRIPEDISSPIFNCKLKDLIFRF